MRPSRMPRGRRFEPKGTSSMKRLVAAVALSAVVGFAGAGSGLTQPAADIPQNPKIRIKYEPVSQKNAARFGALAKRLEERKVLEQFSQVLSPLQLKSELLVVTAECPEHEGPNSDYTPGIQRLRMCYEMLDFIENGAAVPPAQQPRPPRPFGPYGLHPEVTRVEAILGGWVGIFLHEAGHAVFDIQKIPRLGKEEDAADQIAAFIMVQFGTEVSRIMVKGSYNLWRHMHGVFGPGAAAGVHSLNLQRSHNYLCIGYGGQPEALKDLADRWLSEARKENCAAEFKQAQLAFRKTFIQTKYIDEELMKKVQVMTIFRPGDLRLP
jgi:hypothetical protein